MSNRLTSDEQLILYHNLEEILLLLWKLNLSSSLILFGLILVIQFVHYPSFLWIEEERFSQFEEFHSRSITKVVAPLMILELGASLALLLFSQKEQILTILNLISVILIWASTIFLSIPCHRILSKGKNKEAIHRLIETNWFRTVLWGLRSITLLICIE